MSSALLVLLCCCFEEKFPTIRGIDLSKQPVVDVNSVAELFEPVVKEKGSRKRAWRKTVFKMPIISDKEKSAWVYFPAGTDHFYINYRSDQRKPETEKLFGPIAGDPFKLLKLESEMIEKIKSDRGYDVQYRLKLMFRTEDESLTRRAFRVLYRMTERNVEGYALDENLRQLKSLSRDYARVLQQHVRPEQLRKFHAKIAAAEQKIASLVKEFPDEDYTLARDAEPAVPKEIAPACWGEPVNGLRMAMVPAESTEADLGDPIWLLLVLENTTETAINLSVSDVPQSVQLKVLLPNGKSSRPSGVWFSGISPIQRFRIPPHERMVVGKVAIKGVEDRVEAGGAEYAVSVVAHKPTGGKLSLNASGTLLIGYGSAWTRDPDNVMRKTSPAKGEYIGSLTTGKLELTYKESPAKEKNQ